MKACDGRSLVKLVYFKNQFQSVTYFTDDSIWPCTSWPCQHRKALSGVNLAKKCNGVPLPTLSVFPSTPFSFRVFYFFSHFFTLRVVL